MCDWLFCNFGLLIEQVVQGMLVDVNFVVVIVCKEMVNVWLSWIDWFGFVEVLVCCVFDGSGDVFGILCSVFLCNVVEFCVVVGDVLIDVLIEEVNEICKLCGYGLQCWFYKGYGLFQYDLQYFKIDFDFFCNCQWGDFVVCLDCFMCEMCSKLVDVYGDLVDVVCCYNGSGLCVEQYCEYVMFMYGWLKDVFVLIVY